MAVPSRVRPSAERVREALFSIWADAIPGCRFLDLFCGSGVVGLEAASRGAARVTFVDDDVHVLRQVRASCRDLGYTHGGVLRLRLPEALEAPIPLAGHRFDLLFADPPYDFPSYDRLLVATSRLLAPGGAFALEHSRRQDPPQTTGFQRADIRRYGETSLAFYRAPSP